MAGYAGVGGTNPIKLEVFQSFLVWLYFFNPSRFSDMNPMFTPSKPFVLPASRVIVSR